MWQFITVLVVWLSFTACSAGIGLSDVLITLKQGLQGNAGPDAQLSDWQASTNPCGDAVQGLQPWSGVTCDPSGTSVLELRLANQGLTGSIPTAIAQLTSLKYLQLDGNQLQGSLPASLASMTDLQVLSAKDNRLSGLLSAELGNLRQLQSLNLAGNQLYGNLPGASWSGLHNLRDLDLSFNRLEGPLPAAWAHLGHLLKLNLKGNMLDGVLPGSWFSSNGMQELRLLDVSDNILQGPLPHILPGTRMSLQMLSVAGNDLSGVVPRSLARMTSLVLLDIKGNPKLCGSIPYLLPGRPAIDISGTSLIAITGPRSSNETTIGCPWQPQADVLLAIKASLQQADQHQQLSSWVEGFEPCGIVPWAGLSCKNGVVKGLSLTQVQGAMLPEAISGLQGLVSLQISNSTFTGPLPSSWSSLSNLHHLNLSACGASGTLPEAWRALKSLETLDLSHNLLQGTLPESWGDGMQSLQAVYLQGNVMLQGPVPASWSHLSNLTLLTLPQQLLAAQAFSTNLQALTNNRLPDLQQMPTGAGIQGSRLGNSISALISSPTDVGAPQTTTQSSTCSPSFTVVSGGLQLQGSAGCSGIAAAVSNSVSAPSSDNLQTGRLQGAVLGSVGGCLLTALACAAIWVSTSRSKDTNTTHQTSEGMQNLKLPSVNSYRNETGHARNIKQKLSPCPSPRRGCIPAGFADTEAGLSHRHSSVARPRKSMSAADYWTPVDLETSHVSPHCQQHGPENAGHTDEPSSNSSLNSMTGQPLSLVEYATFGSLASGSPADTHLPGVFNDPGAWSSTPTSAWKVSTALKNREWSPEWSDGSVFTDPFLPNGPCREPRLESASDDETEPVDSPPCRRSNSDDVSLRLRSSLSLAMGIQDVRNPDPYQTTTLPYGVRPTCSVGGMEEDVAETENVGSNTIPASVRTWTMTAAGAGSISSTGLSASALNAQPTMPSNTTSLRHHQDGAEPSHSGNGECLGGGNVKANRVRFALDFPAHTGFTGGFNLNNQPSSSLNHVQPNLQGFTVLKPASK